MFMIPRMTSFVLLFVNVRSLVVQQRVAKMGCSMHKGQCRPPRAHLWPAKSRGCEPGEAKPPILTALLSGYLHCSLNSHVLSVCVTDCIVFVAVEKGTHCREDEVSPRTGSQHQQGTQYYHNFTSDCLNLDNNRIG